MAYDAYTLESITIPAGTLTLTVSFDSSLPALTKPSHTVLEVSPIVERLDVQTNVIDLETLTITCGEDYSTYANGFWFNAIEAYPDLDVRLTAVITSSSIDYCVFSGSLLRTETQWEERYVSGTTFKRIVRMKFASNLVRLKSVNIGELITEALTHATELTIDVDAAPGTNDFKVVTLRELFASAMKIAFDQTYDIEHIVLDSPDILLGKTEAAVYPDDGVNPMDGYIILQKDNSGYQDWGFGSSTDAYSFYNYRNAFELISDVSRSLGYVPKYYYGNVDGSYPASGAEHRLRLVTRGRASQQVTMSGSVVRSTMISGVEYDPYYVVIEDCEDVWTDGSGGDVTVAQESTIKKTGTYSVKLTVASGAGVELLAYEDFTAVDLSSYSYLVAWIYSSVATSSGDFQFLLDNTSACASPLETLDVPALEANVWTRVCMYFTTPSALTAVISVGLKQAVDKGACTIYIDDVRAVSGKLSSVAVYVSTPVESRLDWRFTGSSLEAGWSMTYNNPVNVEEQLNIPFTFYVGVGAGLDADTQYGTYYSLHPYCLYYAYDDSGVLGTHYQDAAFYHYPDTSWYSYRHSDFQYSDNATYNDSTNFLALVLCYYMVYRFTPSKRKYDREYASVNTTLTANGMNIVSNSSFEVMDGDTVYPAIWEFAAVGASTADWDSTDSNTGTYSLALTADGVGINYAAVQQLIFGDTGNTYALSIYCKAASGTPELKIYWGVENVANITTSTSWTEHTAEFTGQNGYFTIRNNTTTKINVDDVTLRLKAGAVIPKVSILDTIEINNGVETADYYASEVEMDPINNRTRVVWTEV